MFSLIFVYFACWTNYVRSWYEWLTTPDDGADEINDIFGWFYEIEDSQNPPTPVPTNDEMVLILKPGEDTPTSYAPRNKIPAGAVMCASYVAILCRESPNGPVNVLMLQHGLNSKWANSFDLPGGAVAKEDGTGYEAMERAAFRECKEECGIDVDGSMRNIQRRLLLRPKNHNTVAFNAVFIIFVSKKMFSLPGKTQLESKFDCACWVNIGTAIKCTKNSLESPHVRAKNDIPHILQAILHAL